MNGAALNPGVGVPQQEELTEGFIMETGCLINGVLLLIHSPPGTPRQAYAISIPEIRYMSDGTAVGGHAVLSIIVAIAFTFTPRGLHQNTLLPVHSVSLFAVYIYKSIAASMAIDL